MKNIRLVLCDIDGTLLNSQNTLTPKTREAISKLKNKNIQFGIATGRTPYAVKKLIVDWGIEEYVDVIMGFNGSCCYYVKEKTMSSCDLLDGKYIQEIMQDFKEFDPTYTLYDKEELHCTKVNDIVKEAARGNKLTICVDDFHQYFQKQVEKILIVEPPEKLQQIKSFYEENINTTHYKAVQSSPVLLEFLNPQLSKSKGIQQICKDLNIHFNNILAFGDEMNDFEMIRDCVGVAMGNANEKIKEVAQYVTDSNDNDGIAQFLNQYIL